MTLWLYLLQLLITSALSILLVSLTLILLTRVNVRGRSLSEVVIAHRVSIGTLLLLLILALPFVYTWFNQTPFSPRTLGVYSREVLTSFVIAGLLYMGWRMFFVTPTAQAYTVVCRIVQRAQELDDQLASSSNSDRYIEQAQWCALERLTELDPTAIIELKQTKLSPLVKHECRHISELINRGELPIQDPKTRMRIANMILNGEKLDPVAEQKLRTEVDVLAKEELPSEVTLEERRRLLSRQRDMALQQLGHNKLSLSMIERVIRYGIPLPYIANTSGYKEVETKLATQLYAIN